MRKQNITQVHRILFIITNFQGEDDLVKELCKPIAFLVVVFKNQSKGSTTIPAIEKRA